MRSISQWAVAGLLSSAVGMSSVCLAQDARAEGEANGTVTATVGNGDPAQNLPPPQSDDDPRPEAPAPMVAVGGVTEQAGVGGTQAYARAGVLELGGSANFTLAKDFRQFGFSPTIGWFFIDNFEISLIAGINRVHQKVDVAGTKTDVDSTVITLLAEPSFHLPFNDMLYGFVGVGAGLAYQDPGVGAGFAIAPRLGVNVMVGRSGIFTPALFAVYQTSDAVTTSSGTTVVGVSSTFGLQAGYTVMW